MGGKRNWVQGLTFVVCAVLLVVTFGQGRRIGEMEARLDSRIDHTRSVLQADIENISHQVRRELEESTRLAVNHVLEPTGLDTETHSLLAAISVTLRRWAEDTRAMVLVEIGEETMEIPLTHGGNGVFTAPLSLPAEERNRMSLSLAVTTGGATTRESLGDWEDVFALLPLRRSGWGSPVWTEYRNGMLTLASDLSMGFYDRSRESAPVKDPVCRVYRNGALVLERPASTDPYEVKTDRYNYYLVADAGVGVPEVEQVRVDCAPGDELLVAFACTDEYGLGYEFAHSRLTITEHGPEETAPLVSDDYPRLTWPE